MTSICSSPPNAYNHGTVTTSPTLASRKSLSHLQKGLTSPVRKPAHSPTSLGVPPLHLPRGHDSSDVAALSSSMEETASMANLAIFEERRSSIGKDVTTIGTQATAKESDCLLDDGEPQGPFEGPEKLLELWFADSKDDVRGQGLKEVESQVWEEMLDIVKCKVLSMIKKDDVDAYLLSESSMFVFPHKLILKTCGTTTLLLGLEKILQIAHTSLANTSPAALPPLEKLGKLVKQCFYSRKSFMFPERQKGPHKDWMLEVGLLDRFFAQGSAYTVGKMNGDHWLLYMTPATAPDAGTSLAQVQRPLRLPSPGTPRTLSDQTLEILMTHLSPSSCARFEFPADACVPSADEAIGCAGKDRGHLLGTHLANELGLRTLFPGTTLDAFAFEPCGFSANAIVAGDDNGKTVEDGYWTVHVTPEQDSSYASFETNVHMDETGSAGKKDLPWLIAKVLSIFEPARLSVTLFTSSDSNGDHEGTKHDQGDVLHALQLDNYKRTDRIAYEFEDYDLVFVSFDKLGACLPRR